MKKLIRDYQGKNRIIEEIERNLRIGHSKNSKSLFKTNQIAQQYYHVDLPTILNKQEYSPKSHNQIGLDKKLPILSRQEEKKLPINPRKSWIQTITFKEQQSNKANAILFINKRMTIKNFQLTSNKLKDGQDSTPLPEMFLSPRKMMSINKSKKILKLQRKDQIFANFFEDPEFDAAMRNQNNVSKTIVSERKNSESPPQKIKSAQMEKKSYSYERAEERQIEFYSLVSSPQHPSPSLSLPPSCSPSTLYRYTKSKKKDLMQKRVCSPWHSDQSQQIHEIWNLENGRR